MANELNVRLDPVDDTGLTLTGRVRAQGGTQEGSDVVMSEVASSAYYTGTFSLAAVSDGVYSVEFIDDASGNLVGSGDLVVKDNAELTLVSFNNFNPASDAVANVTLVGTCTTNTDMRGTDGANTITPATATAIADAVCDEDLAGHTTAGTLGKALIDSDTLTNVKPSIGI